MPLYDNVYFKDILDLNFPQADSLLLPYNPRRIPPYVMSQMLGNFEDMSSK